MENRRDYARRAQLVVNLLERLKEAPHGAEVRELAEDSAARGEIFERILKRLAFRRLAHRVAPGLWRPSPILLMPVPLDLAAA